jgi:hypothetical protein
VTYPPGARHQSANGTRYMADVHGTLRRVMVASNGVDKPTVYLAKRWDKARTKAEKRKRHAFRNEYERRVASGDPNP